MTLPSRGKKKTNKNGAETEPSYGRGRFDLLPAKGLRRVAQRFEDGAEKYSEDNWRNGIPQREKFDKAVSHLFYWLIRDPEDDHLAASGFWILAMIEDEDRKDLDNRYENS